MLAALFLCSTVLRWPASWASDANPVDPTPISVPAGNITLKADFFSPPTPQAPFPAVLLLHGWHLPDDRPASGMQGYADAFLNAGYAVIVPTLRGWSPTGGVDDCAGEQVNDVLQALDWVSNLPDVNAHRLYLVGYSQGAQIALLAASRGAQVRAVAAFAPVSGIASWGAETTYPGIRDYVQEECGGPDGWPSRDPLAAAGGLRLPVLLVHGSKDKRVPTEQSVSLYRRLRELDRPVRLKVLPDTGHYIGAVLRPELAISFFRDLGAGDSRSTAEVK